MMKAKTLHITLMLALATVFALSACRPPGGPPPSAPNNNPAAVPNNEASSSNQTVDQTISNLNNPSTKSNTHNLVDLLAANLSVSTTADYILIQTNALPTDHTVGQFPDCDDSNQDGRQDNPNEIVSQNITLNIPLNPRLSDRTQSLFPLIGIALNGVPFYGPGTSEGAVAVEAEVFDACNGHPDPTGIYHYHQNPSCSLGLAVVENHAGLLGVALDGFEIYSFGDNDIALDQCNGHQHDIDGDGDIDEHDYHYHTTTSPLAPILGCFHGIPEHNRIEQGEFMGNRCR